MSFIYPRRIRIMRPLGDAIARPGLQEEYGALDRDKEQVIAADLPASIQHKSSSGRPEADLPADTSSATIWAVFIPRRAAPPKGRIKNRDIVIDDLGNRYQVFADYWSPMGFTLRTERLEA